MLLLALVPFGCARYVTFVSDAARRGEPDRAAGVDRAVDGRPRDAARRDGAGKVGDRQIAVLEGPVPCAEPVDIVIAASCSQQHPGCTPGGPVDPDCDGLSGARDPWPTTCNSLVVLERFIKSVAPGWSLTAYAAPGYPGGPCGGIAAAPAYYCSAGGTPATCPAGSTCVSSTSCFCKSQSLPAWTCTSNDGRVQLPASSDHYLTFDTATGALLNADFLVELRITLGAVSSSGDWSVGMWAATDYALGQFRECSLWVNTTYSQPNAGLHLVAHATAAEGMGTWTAGSNFPAAVGQSYILQSWAEGTTQQCRLLSPDGAQILATKSLTMTLAKPGHLHIETKGRAAEVNDVRVFAH